MEKKPLSKIFTPRRAYKPFEYPETMTFVELMQKSYWVHSEVNFDPDIQDFKSYLYPYEQEAIKRALLGIAQVEVSVKTFWGDLYDIFPKPEFNCLGMSFGECHIEGTEIMTDRGFIDFRDLKMTDKVATFDEDRKITFVKPDNIINKYYKGEMYSFDNTFINAVVTPNHRFALYSGKNNTYVHKEASHIDYESKKLKMPVSGIFKDNASVLTPIDRLKIAIELFARKKDKRNINFKDYFPYKIRIKDTDTYAKSRIEEIFKELPHIQVRRSIDSYGYATYDFHLNKFEGNARKFDWVMEDTRRFDRKFAYSFITELLLWNSEYYTTTKKDHADIVHFLGTVAGYRTNLGIRIDKRTKDLTFYRYVLTFKNKEFSTFSTLKPTKINYEGNVYCATVKNTGNLITRYKDKILFSGNSETRHSEAYSRLLEVLGYEEEFGKLLEIPIFQKREEIIRNKLKKTENSIEKILFFTLIIENASLFSQFATILSMTKFKGRLKSTANMIAWTSIDENCLDLETTKILTVKGWRMLRDVKEGDEVFAFSDGKIKVEKVLKTTRRKLGKEKMFKFGNSYSNILMTAGHDVIFKDTKTGRYLKTRADHFRKSGHKLIPITGHLESKKDSVLTDEEKLMIAIQCDGHLRKLRNSKGELTYMGQVNGGKNVVFAMKREDKIRKLENLLNSLNIDYTKNETNEKGYTTFRFNYDLWNKPFPKRYDWVNLKNLSKKYAEDFISEILSWGSSYTEVGTLVYSTRDKELAEFIQAVGTLAGYVVNFKKRCRKGDKISYNLNFIYKDFGTISSTSYKAIKVEKSEDTEVGCVTVPSGGIIVKHELGRPMITGNCHANAGTWIINSILAENPEYRDSLESYITHEVIEYMKMEDEMIDWIFECGELQHLPKKHLKDYMRYRIDTSLENLGFGRAFGTNSSHLIPLQWFEEEVFSGETDDFFAKRPTAYTKHDQSITKDDLF
jgi:ribonucleoside-diphosphate reductase|uniref:ribonucleoside-diphosphate reductase n=1 Tax=Myoviridae sp. ctA4D8 TaxID=2823535 RepID=A0A8S5L6G1_9CAUD|nr:MAG TPA: ribonucleotide reductase, small chain [Myoviridae sp. ctA4D8]